MSAVSQSSSACTDGPSSHDVHPVCNSFVSCKLKLHTSNAAGWGFLHNMGRRRGFLSKGLVEPRLPAVPLISPGWRPRRTGASLHGVDWQECLTPKGSPIGRLGIGRRWHAHRLDFLKACRPVAGLAAMLKPNVG